MQFELKFVVNKYILFSRESEMVCIPLRGNPFQKQINDETRIHVNLKTTEILNIKPSK